MPWRDGGFGAGAPAARFGNEFLSQSALSPTGSAYVPPVEVEPIDYKAAGKVPLNPARLDETLRLAGEESQTFAQGVGGAVGTVVGGLAGIVSTPFGGSMEGGAEVGGGIGRTVGGFASPVLEPIGSALGFLGSLPLGHGYLTGWGDLDYVRQNDPEAARRIEEATAGNPLALLDQLNLAVKEADRIRVEKGETPKLLSDMGTPTNLGEELGFLLKGLMLPGRYVQRGLVGTSPMGAGKYESLRALQFAAADAEDVSPELLDLQKRFKEGLVSEDELLDELVMSGQTFFSAQEDGKANIPGALLNLAADIATDPLIWATFGTGTLAKGAATATEKAGMAFFRTLGERIGADEAGLVMEGLNAALKAKMSPKTLASMQKANTYQGQLFKEAIRQGVHPEVAGRAIASLSAREQALYAASPILEPVYRVIKATQDFPFGGLGKLGRRGNETLVNAHTAAETTRALANAVGLPNYTAMRGAFEEAGIVNLFDDAAGNFAANQARFTVGDEIARDVTRTGVIRDVSPTKIAETRLVQSFGKKTFGSMVELRIRSTMRSFAPTGKQTREAVMAAARENAVGQMRVITGGRMADDAIETLVAGMDEQGLAFIDMLTFGRTTRKFKAAQRSAMLDATVRSNAELAEIIDRATLIGPRELTTQRAAVLLEAIKNKDVAAVRAAVRDYDQLSRVFAADGVKGRELMEGVEQWLKDHGKGLTSEIPEGELLRLPKVMRDYADEASETGHRLGQRPTSDRGGEYRVVLDESGRVIDANPWIDLTDDVAEQYAPGRLETARERLTRGISTERIAMEAKVNFRNYLINDPLKRFDRYTFTPQVADDLWAAVNKHAQIVGVSPRGLSMHELAAVGETVKGLSKAMRKGRVTARDLQDAVLMGWEGRRSTVGLSQELTGKIKRKVGVATGNNFIGTLAEDMYPKLRFGSISVLFQVQEGIEPYAMAAMRGMSTTVNADEFDKTAWALMDRYQASNAYAKFDFMERSGAYLWGDKAARLAGTPRFVADDPAKRFSLSWFGRAGHNKHAKSMTELRYYRAELGRDMKERFDKIDPLMWPRLQAHYGTTDSGVIATRWLAERSPWASTEAVHLESSLQTQINRSFQFGNAAKRVDLDAVAKRVGLPSAKVLGEDFRRGAIKADEIEASLKELGATDNFVERVHTMLAFDPDKFWDDLHTVFGESEDSVKALRALVKTRALAADTTEHEYMARRLSSGPVSVGSSDFIGMTATEREGLGVLMQAAGDPANARLWTWNALDKYGKKVPAGEVKEIEAKWLSRATLRNADNTAVSEDAQRIIDRMESSSPGSSAMAPLEKVAVGDRYIYVPGGRAALLDPQRQWTVWEANVLRSQMINPADITDEPMKVGLYRNTWRAHDTDLTDPDVVHEFVNNITFAMLSPNMNLTRNEIAQTRMKVRALVDITPTGETALLQRGDTIFGLADQHDDIVGIIEAALGAGKATTNEIGFARSTRIGNYVPMSEVDDFLGAGRATDEATGRMAIARDAATDYLENGGYRASHNLRMSPIAQMVADRLEKTLSDPSFTGNWRDAAASMAWLEPKSEKVIRGAVKTRPTRLPVLTGKEDWYPAYQRLTAEGAPTALRGPKGGFLTPTKAVIETTMKDDSIPLAARTRWVEQIEFDKAELAYFGPGNAGATAAMSNEKMLALLQGVREDIKTSEGRLEELLNKEADDPSSLTEADWEELESLATSANGQNIDALKTIFKNLKEVDDDVAIKPWRYTPGGVGEATMDAASVAKPYAYIKNPDVVWRNMATNRALGSIMKMMKDVAEDPAFYRIRPGEQPSQFAERILNVTDGLAMKTGYFSVDLSGVEKFDRGIMDRQMVGAVTIDVWERTHTKSGKFISAAAEAEWNSFRSSLSTNGGKLVDKWVASGRPTKAGEFSWTDAMPAKIGVLKGNPAKIAELKAAGPTAVRAWVNAQIEGAVKRGGLSREDADRFLSTFTEDGDLARVIGRNVTIYGADYKVYDQMLGAMKARQTALGGDNAWLAEVGNGAYQWYLWDEYRNIFDPELTVMRQSHTLDRVSSRALAISDDVHGAAGYLDKGGLPRIAGDAKVRNIPSEGAFGYNYMDPVETLLAHAAGGGKVRGATLTMEDGKRLIAISELKDRTTALHEMVHALFEPDLSPSMRAVVLDDFNTNAVERTTAHAAALTQATSDHITAVADYAKRAADAELAGAEVKAARAVVADSNREISVAENALQKAHDAHVRIKTKNDLLKRQAEAEQMAIHAEIKRLRAVPGHGVWEAVRELPGLVKRMPEPGQRVRVDTALMLSDYPYDRFVAKFAPIIEKVGDTNYLTVPTKVTRVPKADTKARWDRIKMLSDRISRLNRETGDAGRKAYEAQVALDEAKSRAGGYAQRLADAETVARDAITAARAAEKTEIDAADMLAALRAKTMPEQKAVWDSDVSEHFVKQFQTWVATEKAPSAKMREAFAYFAKVLLAAWDYLKSNPDAKVSDEMKSLFDDLFKIKDRLPDARPFDATQEMFHQAAVTSSRIAEDAAHTFVYFRNNRSWLERSLNHQFFGYYPASYMYGKVLPELVRFLAYEPFGVPAPLGGFLAAQRAWNSFELQKDSDTEFRDRLEKSKEMIRLGGILLPATPFEVPVNMPLYARRVAAWGNEATDPNRVGPAPSFDVGKVGGDIIDYSFGLANTITTVREALGMTQNAVGEMVEGLGEETDVMNTGPAVPVRVPVQ